MLIGFQINFTLTLSSQLFFKKIPEGHVIGPVTLFFVKSYCCVMCSKWHLRSQQMPFQECGVNAVQPSGQGCCQSLRHFAYLRYIRPGDSSPAYILFICNDILKHSSQYSKQSKRVYGNAPCSKSLLLSIDILFTLPQSQYSLNRMVV